MNRYSKLIALLAISLWPCAQLSQAQSVSLSVQPPLITTNPGEIVEFDCTITADSFSQQLFFTVEQTNFPANAGNFEFLPSLLNSPYTDTARLRITTLGTMDPGTYTFVVQGGNGPVSDLDTVTLQVEGDSCSWLLSNPPDLGSEENLIGLGSDGLNTLWITAESRLIQFDSLNWSSYPYPNDAVATAAPVVDHLGRVLVPSTQGLLIWDGTAWTSFTATNSPLPNNFVGSVLEAPNQDLYLGTKGGLAIYDGEFWSVYDSSFTNLPYNDIRSLVYLDSQAVWGIMHTSASASFIDNSYLMVKFNGSDFEVPTSRTMIPCEDSTHFALSVDAEDNLWVGSQTGVIRTKAGEWEKWNRRANSPNHLIHDDSCNLLLADDAARMDAAFITYVYADGSDVWIMGAPVGNGFDHPPAQLARKRDTTWDIFTTQNSTLPDPMVRSMTRVGSRLWFITYPDYWYPQGGAKLSYIGCESVTSIREPALLSSDAVRVFPNPAAEVVRIEYHQSGLIEQVQLMDLQGRLMQSHSPRSSTATLSLTEVPSGIYLIKLATTQGTVQKKLWVR